MLLTVRDGERASNGVAVSAAPSEDALFLSNPPKPFLDVPSGDPLDGTHMGSNLLTLLYKYLRRQ